MKDKNMSELFLYLKQTKYTIATGRKTADTETLFYHAHNFTSVFETYNAAQAIAMAEGSAAAGVKSVVFIDKETFPTAVPLLASVNRKYDLPFLGLMTQKHEPHIEDELLLHKIKISSVSDEDSLVPQLEKALEYMNNTKKPHLLSLPLITF